MKKIKYPIREIDLNCIKSNQILAVSVKKSETEFVERNIRQHGLLTPLVIVEKINGEQITVCGEAEIQALKNMGFEKTDVMVSELKNRADVGKLTLLMAGISKGLNPVTEGIILKDMLTAGKFTQKELAVKLKKSQGWISKRLALAHNLKDTVIEMVLSKMICPRSAEEISRIPEELQHRFAVELSKLNLSKSNVERLVLAYRKDDTPQTLKDEIITNPSQALHRIGVSIKVKNIEYKDSFDLKRLDSSMRLFLKLELELEDYISKLEKEVLNKYLPLLMAIIKSCENLCNSIHKNFPEPNGDIPQGNIN